MSHLGHSRAIMLRAVREQGGRQGLGEGFERTTERLLASSLEAHSPPRFVPNPYRRRRQSVAAFSASARAAILGSSSSPATA